MIFLYILLVILAVILLLLFASVSVIVEYDEEVSVKIGYLFFRIDVIKYLKNQKNKKKSNSGTQINEPEKKKTEKKDILGFIRFLADVTKKIAGEFSRVVKIKLKYLDIRVSSDEADKTALLYGTVSGAVAILIDIFKNFLKFDYDPEKVVVRSDFTQSEMKLKTKVIFKARLIQGIIAIINVIKLLTEKGKVK